MRFEWDDAKERENVARHGVDFATAQEAFADPCCITLYDSLHSSHRELRWKLLGRAGSRILLVRYTHRPGGVVRIIGAGYWRKGRKYYEDYWKEKPHRAAGL